MTAAPLKTAQHRLQAFADGRAAGQEPWKDDHDLAMECYDFEVFLQGGIALYESLTFLRDRFARAVLEGQTASVAVTEGLWALFENWLAESEKVLEDLKRFEDRFDDVKWSNKFRAAVEECRAYLQNEDLSDDDLQELL